MINRLLFYKTEKLVARKSENVNLSYAFSIRGSFRWKKHKLISTSVKLILLIKLSAKLINMDENELLISIGYLENRYLYRSTLVSIVLRLIDPLRMMQ